MQKAKEKGMYPLTAADQSQIDMAVEQLSSSIAQYGLTEDSLKTLLTQEKVYMLMKADAVKDAAVTDDEVKAEYDKELTSQKESFTADASAYETAVSGGSTVIVYKPEGYRYIKHILIAMPSDIATQISTAQSSGDTDTVKKLREQGLPQIKAKADEVLAKVQAGGDFDSLMAEYGEDPGMQQDPAKTNGYELGAATSFVQEFKDAALALANVGDTTGLVASDYGYHIIKYVGNVPSGPVAFDSVKDALKAQLLTAKQDDLWTAAIDQWKSEAKIEQHPEKIPVATAAATAASSK
jgi:peptidyl-prolyl cis-trans isomerase C